MALKDRLQLYRRAGGVSLADLAKATGLPQRKLVGFEKGTAIDAESLASLAEFFGTDPELLALDVPIAEVSAISDQVDGIEDVEIDQIGAQAQLWLERYRLVESQIPPDDRRLLGYPDGFPRAVESPKEAAAAADALRISWRLSSLTAVGTLSDLLESTGVRVGFIPGVPRLSALALLAQTEPRLPLIAVRADLPGDSQRFGMAREMAYFLLENCTAKLAAHFAGALLIPAEALAQDVGTGRTDLELYELALLKQKYGVSMRHILARAATLRLIPAEAHKQWMEIFEAQGWNQHEPGAPYPSEESRLMMRRVMRLQIEDKVGVGQAAALLGMSFEAWANRLSLDGALRFAVI